MKDKNPAKDNQTDDEVVDRFGEMIAAMDIEDLIRFRKKLELDGRKKMVRILSFEIKSRQSRDKTHDEAKQLETRVKQIRENHRKEKEQGT